jgi:hypothetical protein
VWHNAIDPPEINPWTVRAQDMVSKDTAGNRKEREERKGRHGQDGKGQEAGGILEGRGDGRVNEGKQALSRFIDPYLYALCVLCGSIDVGVTKEEDDGWEATVR